MRYVAKQPREGINVSKTHPLVEAGTLIVGLSLIFVTIVVLLIFLIELSLQFISPEKEAELFANWHPEDIVSVADDDVRRQGTQALVDRLAAHWPESPYTFRVVIDESTLANAVAMPGGLIVVTAGLLDQVESENELAFVLSHELGHFRNRDHLRALGRGVVIVLVFAVIVGNDGAGIGVTAADITLRGFSRRQESEADAFGLGIVSAEYGHVNQASRLFERWQHEDESDLQLIGYLSTHPDTGKRIRVIGDLAEENRWSGEGEITPLVWQ